MIDSDFDPVADVELDADFGTRDAAELVTHLLVRGESRDSAARHLGLTRADVDEHVAMATAQTEAEALDERDWIAREQLRDLVRQASRTDLPSFEVTRLALLLELAKLELALIARIRREKRAAETPVSDTRKKARR